LRKSIAAGDRGKIVLLPSRVTLGFAEKPAETVPDIPVAILPLPGEGMENGADACYAHFPDVSATLKIQGFENNHNKPHGKGTKPCPGNGQLP
jgi:hypothetical protein